MLLDAQARRNHVAFTLIELLVGAAVFMLILTLMLGVLSQTSDIFRRNTAQTEQFREARRAFETISRFLAQATLNTYWDYQRNAQGAPVRYARSSELRFACGPAAALGLTPPSGIGQAVTQAAVFQVPEGITDDSAIRGKLGSLLNTVGFYVAYGSDASFKPSHATATEAFRLFLMVEPTESFSIYNFTSGGNGTNIRRNSYVGKDWLQIPASAASNSSPLASNIIALIFEPIDPAAASTSIFTSGAVYDSSPTTVFTSASGSTQQEAWENNLPPTIRVTMVAVDGNSAKRLDAAGITPAYLNALFTDPAQIAANLSELGSKLDAKGLSYQVFSAQVPVEASKWSSQ
jgi:uncharacterized protein (TIGR02599 family)